MTALSTATPPATVGLPAAPGWAQDVLAGYGYQPIANTDFSPGSTIDAIIGQPKAAADSQLKVFFFSDRKFLGNDTPDLSRSIQFVRADGAEVALDYALYHPSDAECCPTAGAQTVRFEIRNGALTHLDPIPPSGDVDPSRR